MLHLITTLFPTLLISYCHKVLLFVEGVFMKSLFVLALCMMSSSLVASTKVVYGEDNRKDVYETTNPLFIKLAQSTAGMVSNRLLQKNSDNTYSIKRKISLEEGMNLCPSEKFSQQPLLANCSGFLVGEDILVSAGHCFKGQAEGSCQNASWVFGMQMDDENSINLDSIAANNVYRCKRVIKAVLDDKQDFAVIQLDRKVNGRAPLKFRTEGKVTNKSQLVVIGHPTMMPTKIADGGTVLQNFDAYQFTTTLDTFQGNSGSAVFDSETGILEGILVSGKTDYIPSDTKDPESCVVVNVCDMDGTNCMGKDRGSLYIPGENVTRITTLTQYIP
jgi:hypothetical protein